MDVSVILVNYNTADLLPRAIGALMDASVGLNVQTIIVDNASRDDSVERIRRDFSDCSLIVNTTNVGFVHISSSERSARPIRRMQ